MSLPMPTVRITEDNMEAYMTAPQPLVGENYTVDYLSDVLRLNHIKIGILPERLQQLIDHHLYDREVLVAEGVQVEHGKSGYYEYFFERDLSQKPIENEDGTVDYKNIKMIELVEEGQTIAIYHEATAGTNGYNLSAQFQNARHGGELPPLKGTGFQRLEDGVTYVASVSGKIMELNNRVNIFPVHELFGDVDLSTGNIDFNGDVIIHGSVLDGMSIKATGTVTVDKIVESAYIEGKKGVILRGGVLGRNGAKIRSKGNITALFFEYADVETEGDIEADSFLDSRVYAGGRIRLSGKKSCIVGGTTHAAHWIEAGELGNQVGANTEVSVGVSQEQAAAMMKLEKLVKESESQLRRIEDGLVRFEETMRERGLPFRDDPRRTALLKEKIRLAAQIAGNREELNDYQLVRSDTAKAFIRVKKKVYPCVRVCVDEQFVQVQEEQTRVEFTKYMGKLGMFNIGFTVND